MLLVSYSGVGIMNRIELYPLVFAFVSGVAWIFGYQPVAILLITYHVVRISYRQSRNDL